MYTDMLPARAPKIYRSGGSWGRGVHETVKHCHAQKFHKKYKILASIAGGLGDWKNLNNLEFVGHFEHYSVS